MWYRLYATIPWDKPSFSARLKRQSFARRCAMDQTTVISSEVTANESSHHYPARARGRRAVARALAYGHLQRTGGRREPLPKRLRPDRRTAQTTLRADSELGRSRQGLHGPREGDAQRRHQGPQQRDGGRAESCRQPQRPDGREGI